MGVYVLNVYIQGLVNIVNWMHFFLSVEGSKQDLGGMFNVDQAFQLRKQLLNLVRQVNRRSTLVLVST